MPVNVDPVQGENYAARTDIGKVREQNEDSFCVNTELGLYVVADGMGGHASGEVASEIAVTTIEQQVKDGCSMVEAINEAHLAILQGVESGLGRHGMGTTVVAVQLQGDDYVLAWVGDSRAYLWHDGLSQISKDHSMVQMMIDSGQITQQEARTHPRKNIIYQNLGAPDVKVPDVSLKRGTLYKAQKIILCSDGLSDELDDSQIEKIVSSANDEAEAVAMLVTAAIDNGGNDNVSVIMISASSGSPEKPLLDK
jgi:PPM family protein phosphatase